MKLLKDIADRLSNKIIIGTLYTLISIIGFAIFFLLQFLWGIIFGGIGTVIYIVIIFSIAFLYKYHNRDQRRLDIRKIIELARSYGLYTLSLVKLGICFKNKSGISQGKRDVKESSGSLGRGLNRLGLNVSIPSEFSSEVEINSILRNQNEMMAICKGLSEKYDTFTGDLFLFVCMVHSLIFASEGDLGPEKIELVIHQIRNVGKLVRLPEEIIEKCVNAPFEGLDMLKDYGESNNFRN